MYLSLVPLQTNRKLSVGWPQLLSRRNSIIVIEFAKWLDCSCWTLGKAGKTTSMANGWNPYFCSVVKLCESGFVQKPGIPNLNKFMAVSVVKRVSQDHEKNGVTRTSWTKPCGSKPWRSFNGDVYYIHTMWCPPSDVCWFIKPMNTIVISTIHHSYWTY